MGPSLDSVRARASPIDSKTIHAGTLAQLVPWAASGGWWARRVGAEPGDSPNPSPPPMWALGYACQGLMGAPKGEGAKYMWPSCKIAMKSEPKWLGSCPGLGYAIQSEFRK